MTYERAREILRKSNEIGYEVIEDAVRDMPQEEFLKIPVIDEYTRVAAQRYGWCFTVYRGGDFTRYYQMYLISSCLMREEKESITNNSTKH